MTKKSTTATATATSAKRRKEKGGRFSYRRQKSSRNVSKSTVFYQHQLLWTPSAVVVLFILLVADMLLTPIRAATSSCTSYNAYHYDRTTPQFTPDGRLLQVEYASMAADHSSPLVALQLLDNTLLLVTVKPSSSSAFHRMRILDTTNGGDRSTEFVLVQSGVLADSVALVQVLLDEASKHFRQYKQGFTLLQSATAMANACQRHAFGGGIRPYGSTMLLCGLVPSTRTVASTAVESERHDENNHIKKNQQCQSQVQIIQTNPSGALTIHDPPSLVHGNESIDLQVRCLVGGSQTAQSRIRKELEQQIQKLLSSSTSFTNFEQSPKPTTSSSSSSSTTKVTVADALAMVIRVLHKHLVQNDTSKEENDSKQQPQQQPKGNLFQKNYSEQGDKSASHNKDDAGASCSNGQKQQQQRRHALQDRVEAILISPTHGIHRLSEYDLIPILERVETNHKTIA